MKLLCYWNQMLQQNIKLVTCGAYIIGSSDSAHIVLDATGVSKLHCIIETDEHRNATIKDLGSCNGTKVNGIRITVPQQLKPGDLIQVGAVTIVSIECITSEIENQQLVGA